MNYIIKVSYESTSYSSYLMSVTYTKNMMISFDFGDRHECLILNSIKKAKKLKRKVKKSLIKSAIVEIENANEKTYYTLIFNWNLLFSGGN